MSNQATAEAALLSSAALSALVDLARASVVASVEGRALPAVPDQAELSWPRGVFVVPDILANAGGVTVSYFEWVQDRDGYFWTEDTVNQRLEEIMVRSFYHVLDVSKKYNVNMRMGAYTLAIDRVAAVHKMRGMYA